VASPGARHDAYAFTASGIAQRWAGHMAEEQHDNGTLALRINNLLADDATTGRSEPHN
jgi:hypothetical protein